MIHIPVLLKESIDVLALEKGDIYLDATVGGGGHMEEVYRRMKDSVTILGLDADETAVSIAKEKLALSGCHPKMIVQNFRNIDKALEIFGVKAPTKILFDLGWNKMQFEEGERGFSFNRDEPLLMTFSKEEDPEITTAYDVVNVWQEKNLADVIYGYGEEKYARRIAKRIVEERQKKPIESSLELGEIIKSAVPIFYRFGRIHPATKTFQAIRIAVNDELQALKEGVSKAFEILAVGGKIAVISFHSLEDRIIKIFFKELVLSGKAEYLKEIGRRAIQVSKEEMEANQRSRSAKLRVIKKINNN